MTEFTAEQATEIAAKLGIDFGKVPFDRARWEAVARKQYPHGLPAPYSEDPTQWIFKGTITPSTSPLHVAVARLLGYRWPDQEKDDLASLCDRDGIVCIPPVGGEQPAADRLRALACARQRIGRRHREHRAAPRGRRAQRGP